MNKARMALYILFIQIFFLIIFVALSRALVQEYNCLYEDSSGGGTCTDASTFVWLGGVAGTYGGAQNGVTAYLDTINIGGSICGSYGDACTGNMSACNTLRDQNCADRSTYGLSYVMRCKWNTAMTHLTYAIMAYQSNLNPPGTCPDLDSDDDGIPDEYDPYPDNADDFTWQVFAYQDDMAWFCIKTSKGDKFCYGEFDDQQPITLSNSGQTFLPEDLNSYLGGQDQPGTFAPNNNVIPDTDIDYAIRDYEDMADGVDNTGNSVDTDYLADIVENTRQNLSNQQKLGDYMADVQNEIRKTNQILIENGGGGGSVNVNLDGEFPTAQGIADEIKSDLEARDTAAESVTSQAQSDIAGGNETFDGEFTEQDKPEENLLQDIWTDFLQNNPVSSYVNGSELQASGSCSFSWDYKGNQIDFTICPFESQIDLMGGILMGIAGIYSIMIVFRR